LNDTVIRNLKSGKKKCIRQVYALLTEKLVPNYLPIPIQIKQFS